MALVNCPNCGKVISTKAEKCPQCSYEFPQNKRQNRICTDCGAELEYIDMKCQNCGCPVSEIIPLKNKKSKAKGIIIISIILAVIVVAGCIFVNQVRETQ